MGSCLTEEYVATYVAVYMYAHSYFVLKTTSKETLLTPNAPYNYKVWSHTYMCEIAFDNNYYLRIY